MPFPNRSTFIFTTRNEVVARKCFYTCLWFCSQGGLCPNMHQWSHDWGVSVQVGLCQGRYLSRGSLCKEDRDLLYGNERAVRILLECIFVFRCFIAADCKAYKHIGSGRGNCTLIHDNTTLSDGYVFTSNENRPVYKRGLYIPVPVFLWKNQTCLKENKPQNSSVFFL